MIRARRRGMVFVVALGIIVVLTALVLIFAQSMRTEALASANRRSAAEADAIEQGAERWVEAQVDAYQTDAMTITQVPAEAIQVGTGYFWILQYDPDSDQNYLFGITDESGKLNVNSTRVVAPELMALPCDLQQNVADAILDWRNPVNQASSDGAESSYYESLPEPYECKNEPYETVEELLLVDGVTPQLLWGYDLNRNGILEPAERSAGGANVGSFTGAGSGIDGRGIFNYLTCYGNGQVNVNTASDVVLTALGMSPGSAQALVSQRQGQDQTNTLWANSILNGSGVQMNQITGQSSNYSADIVAVSGDGRAFRRVRIVVNVTQTPSKIVYRKDLTSFGWPLPQSIRDALRSGKGIQTGTMQSNLTSSGTIGQNH